MEDEDYIPVEVCFLPYKKEIGHNRYVDYRRSLSRQLEECPQLVKRLDAAYFKDRILAKAALKFGWNLKYLTMYQNDDAMVKYCILHNGESIQYAAKRFQTDREWVKLAIEHSAEEVQTIKGDDAGTARREGGSAQGDDHAVRKGAV